MIPPELLTDYKMFCKGLKPNLERVKKFRTQKSIDEAYIAITDQVSIIINSSVQQRKFCKEDISKLDLIFKDIEKEIIFLNTSEWRRGVYWGLYQARKRIS